MKKLLSGICCILYLNSFSQAPIDPVINSQRASGEKVLIKAIATIMNPEGNKKAPPKTVQLHSSECP